jgi:hypothetical protein
MMRMPTKVSRSEASLGLPPRILFNQRNIGKQAIAIIPPHRIILIKGLIKVKAEKNSKPKKNSLTLRLMILESLSIMGAGQKIALQIN